MKRTWANSRSVDCWGRWLLLLLRSLLWPWSLSLPLSLLVVLLVLLLSLDDPEEEDMVDGMMVIA